MNLKRNTVLFYATFLAVAVVATSAGLPTARAQLLSAADDASVDAAAKEDQTQVDSDSKNEAKADKAAEATKKEADEALTNLADMIRQASASRATVELTARTVIGQEEVSTNKSVYQISSAVPNRYAAYFKSADQSFRIYCDGDFAGVQIGDDAYFKTDAPKSLQAIVTELPVPLGPYPEPILALTIASVDTKASLMTDMQSIEVVDREPYSQTPAMHLRGLQIDGVKWDLWIATEKGKIQPLRMLIDLSKVLTSGDNTELPEGFRYEIDMLFTLWRMSGNYEKKLFTYSPPAGANEYESLEDYYESLAAVPQVHALVGQMSLDFEAEILPVVTKANQEKADSADSKADSDSETTTEATEPAVLQLSDRKGKIVVLDFWATWCGPCIAAMPVIDGVTKKYADKGVEFYALNIGESAEDVQTFFKTAKVRPDVLLDPQSVVADAYKAEAIPQTVVIGKDGRIEAVHVGYSSLEELEQLLTQQLEVLVNDGSLLTELPK